MSHQSDAVTQQGTAGGRQGKQTKPHDPHNVGLVSRSMHCDHTVLGVISDGMRAPTTSRTVQGGGRTTSFSSAPRYRETSERAATRTPGGTFARFTWAAQPLVSGPTFFFPSFFQTGGAGEVEVEQREVVANFNSESRGREGAAKKIWVLCCGGVDVDRPERSDVSQEGSAATPSAPVTQGDDDNGVDCVTVTFAIGALWAMGYGKPLGQSGVAVKPTDPSQAASPGT